MLYLREFSKETIKAYRLDKQSGFEIPKYCLPPAFAKLEVPSDVGSAISLSLDMRIEKAIYVLSADCGTGKSTSVIKALKDWKLRGFEGNGAIVFVATLKEIDSFVNGAGLEREDYAIQTSNVAYANHGSGRHKANLVPVLFATHSMARRVLKEAGTFEAANDFHYQGKPRALRVWDEAFSPVECSSFTLMDLSALASAYKGLPKAQRDVLFALPRSVTRLEQGAVIDIPLGVQEIADLALKGSYKASETAKQTLDAVAKLAGSKAFLTGTGGSDWSLIGTGIPLPVDIAPLIVLDASARLTGRYSDLSPYGMKVVQLKPITLHYGNLNVHWWNRAAGKTELRKPVERATVFQGIADLINAATGQHFLIVMAKEFCALGSDGRVILNNELVRLIDDPDRVEITNWGRHVGINDFREIPNVIIVGSFDYGEVAYDALALGVSGNDAGVVSHDERRIQKDAEFMSNLYQAVCRSAVRNPQEGTCGFANAYLIMKESDHRRALVERTFPGCSFERWMPLGMKKGDKTDLVLAKVIELASIRRVVSKQEVIEACGSNDRSYLTKILGKQRFKDTMDQHGIDVRSDCFVNRRALALAA